MITAYPIRCTYRNDVDSLKYKAWVPRNHLLSKYVRHDLNRLCFEIFLLHDKDFVNEQQTITR